MIQHTNCPDCHSDQLAPFVNRDGINIVQCISCQLVFMNPMYTPAELTEIHRGYYTSQKRLGSTEFGYANYEQDRSPQIMRRSYLSWLTQFATSGSTVLDVGCGTGTLMEVLRSAGYSVVGLEVTEDAWSVLQSKQLDFFDTDIQHASLQSYDNIVMIDVIEHLFSPFDDLRVLASALKPGGKLFIETGDSDPSGLPPHLRHLWPAISPVHLYYWRACQLEWVLKRLGLEVIQLSSHRPRLGLAHWLFNELMRLFKRVGINQLGRYLVTINSSITFKKWWRPDLYGDLSTARIVAQKPNK